MSAALRAMSNTGWRTVVSLGQTIRENSESSGRTHDRQVAGHGNVEFACRHQHAYRHVIVLRQNRGRPRPPCEQSATGLQPQFECVIALLDAIEAHRDATRLHRLGEPDHTRVARPVRRIALHDPDVAVPECDYMLGDLARRSDVVDQIVIADIEQPGRRDPRERQARRLELFEDQRMVGRRRGEDDAVERRRPQRRDDFAAVLTRRSDGDHEQPIALSLEPLEHPHLQIVAITRTWIFRDESEEERALPDKSLGEDVGMIVQVTRGKLNAFRSSALTCGSPLRTRETVLYETPATRATSMIVVRRVSIVKSASPPRRNAVWRRRRMGQQQPPPVPQSSVARELANQTSPGSIMMPSIVTGVSGISRP